MNFSTLNILDCYEQATKEEVRAGISWYYEAQGVATVIANRLGIPVKHVAYALAALSPRNNWDNNIRDLLVLANLYRCHVYSFESNQAKALHILELGKQGKDVELQDVAKKGYKVRSFARLINEPWLTDDVCVDTHAISVLAGVRCNVKDTDKVFKSERKYRECQADYLAAAATLKNVTPSQLQAITWLAWRRILGLSSHHVI